MSQYEYHNAGNTEAQQKEALAYLLAQVSTGKAATGVLSGLAVAQTTTASGSVQVAAGAGVVQAAVLDGASELVNDSTATIDVFTANPMSSLPRKDIIVFDQATLPSGLRVVVGTPNATPADPTVPTSAIPLARLTHAASATTIPTSAITDLRTFTSVFGTSGPTLVTYFTSDSSIPSAGYKKRMDVTASETLGGAALASGHRHTVTRDGLYRVTADQRVTHNKRIFVTLEARKNDSGSGTDGTLLYADYSYVNPLGGIGVSPGFSVYKRMVAGDYVDFFVTVSDDPGGTPGDAVGAIIRGGDTFSQYSVEWVRA